MIKAIISCIFGLCLLACHNPALALEQSEARTLLSSKHYTFAIKSYNPNEAFKIIEVEHLVNKGKYKEALKLLKEVDKTQIFEDTNEPLIPDVAILAKAAGSEEDYEYYRQLAFDVSIFVHSEASCVETSTGFSIKDPGEIKYIDEVTNRMCNAFTVGEKKDISYEFIWKASFLW